MNFIAHRINTIEELKRIDKKYGVEMDIRDYGNDLILSHDPFRSGENFEEYIKNYKHGTLILNIKSERIEWRVLDILKKYNITDYFFLDSSFPMIYLLSEKGEKNIAVRFSEFEKEDTVLAMKDRVKWVWVDCFTKIPLDFVTYTKFKDAGFKLCFVSPELQGREQDILPYKSYFEKNNIRFDAICTKYRNIELWKK